MLGFLRQLRHLYRDTSANAMILSAFALFAMVGGAGLATDTVQWTLWKRQLQRMADSAAISGAYALAGGASASTAANAEIARYSYITSTVTTTIETPPTAGGYSGNAKAVRVVLSTSRTLPFSSLFMNSTPTITAQATGAAVSFGEYCLVSLESTTATGITFQGSSDTRLGCGAASNSQGNPAINASGSSFIIASPIAAVGNVPVSSNYQAGTTVIPYALPQPDPFANLPMMAVPNGNSCNSGFSDSPQTVSTITIPGGQTSKCFNDFNVKGTVTMDPGIYIIDGKNGGSFNLGSQANITCLGCVFLLTTSGASSTVATVNMNGGATVNITAPTSGTYAGVMFYQDRTATTVTTNQVNGNASSKFQGAIYMPKQDVQFSGSSGMNTHCLQIVSRRITMTGNNAIQNDTCTGTGSSAVTGTQVRLVD